MKKSPAMRGPLRVFIADSSSMGCQLMVRALQQSRQPIKVVGSATESGEIIKGLVANRSDVAIISVDLRNGPITGFRVIREARLSCPHIRIIVLVDSPDRALVVEGFRAGADGVFSRDEPFEMLCKCIRAVCEGQIWASSEQLRYVIDALVKDEPQPIKSANGTQLLTKREEELVQLVAEALTNRDIARQLNLTEHTVRNYLFRIFNKLGTSNRLELALYVIKQRVASQGSDSGRTWLAEPARRGLGAGRGARDIGSVAVSSND
jgi:two-component system nitrate/nitrite response regulator NarL